MCVEQLEPRAVPSAAPLVLAFDMGTASSPVADGFVRIDAGSRYSTDTGIGWTSGVVSSLDRRKGLALDRDLVLTSDATFAVDLPNGAYRVEVLLGDAGKTTRDHMAVAINGVERAVVTTRPQRSERLVYDVDVAEQRIAIHLQDRGGRDRSVAVQAVSIAARTGAASPPAPIVSALLRAGPLVHEIASPYQRTTTRIRVLLPDSYDPAKTYRTVYVLPVDPGNATQFGDGLRVVESANLHNVHDTVFVAPSFSDMPWYADHVSNVRIRQESHFMQVVVPYVESRYSLGTTPAERLLLGFSKSGYGAFSMLLRHPGFFGKAAAWDSPLAMSDPRTGWDYPKILGSVAHFANYRVTSLLPARADLLAAGPPRLILSGYSYRSFREQHATVVAQMRALGIPHIEVAGAQRAHVWSIGWVRPLVTQLLA